jgi:diadenylate cyclase
MEFSLHWLDPETFRIVLDVVLVSILIYTILLLVQGTRGLTMLLGLLIIGVFYVVSREFSLVTLNWILGNFLGSVILVIVVLFQDDLRRGLIKVGLIPGFSGSIPQVLEQTIRDITRASSKLSSDRLGALIVFRRDVGLEDFLEHAVKVDGLVSYQLLVSIFQKTSPLHDGAVIIEGERLLAAGAVLPLTFDSVRSSNFGTRHRAAIGLSERTDAVVIVVSEETGRISLVREGRITSDFDEKSLFNALFRLTLLRNRRRAKQARNILPNLLRTDRRPATPTSDEEEQSPP